MPEILPADRTLEPPLRVLVIDKVSVLRSVRWRHFLVAERANVDITLLVPIAWIENDKVIPYQSPESDPFPVVLGKVAAKGQAQRGFYVTGLIRAFRHSRPQVILMLEEGFSFFAVQIMLVRWLLACRVPIIFYNNHIASFKTFAYRLGPLYSLLSRLMIPRMTAAFCINSKAVAALQELGFQGPIVEQFYGVNDTLFVEINKQEARKKLGLSNEENNSEVIFLFAGRLVELKGVQDLIEAFSRLQHQRPNQAVRLLIVGRGEYEPTLRQQAESLQLSGVAFRDVVPQEEMPYYIAAADAMVLPSRAEIDEQFGRVNVEAMLAGTPIIASNSGGIPEVIGDAGYIFQAGDVDDLLEKMLNFLDDQNTRQEQCQQGKLRAKHRFSMDTFADAIIRMLEQVTGRGLR